MSIIDIINKKRLKQELTYEEIKYFVDGYVNDEIKDYQISSLLMAICLNGMTEQEIFDLTDVMLHSGDIIDLSKIDGIVVDKHSTGGVGDKVTLVLAPLLASFGIKIAKMSGRGLGHTGGTIDKLESIPGFNVKISEEQFINQVNDIGISIVSQTGNLVPADKKIYALRDVTGTVESIPLIASSIMSKKLASGADVLLIDVKVGSGALMKNLEDAKKLATLMSKIGSKYNKTTVCVISNMDEPLGYAIGNSLEVVESIETLKGNGPSDLLELVVTLATLIVAPFKKISNEEARSLIFKQLNNGEAYNKLLELVKAQDGKIDKLEVSNRVFSIRSTKKGYINKIDALKLGEIARNIGAGRKTMDDVIDYKVGLILSKKCGDSVEINDELLKVYLGNTDVSINKILDCYVIENELKEKQPLIYDIIK